MSPNNKNNPPNISQKDQELLARLNKHLQIVRDRVTSVAKGYHSGVIITGRGGTSKSWTVEETLEEIGAPYVLHNSHVTPRGLFGELAAQPDSVHVIEEAEEVLHNRVSLGVLRSATWGTHRDREGRVERLISWRANRARHEVIFTGGVVLISNRKLSDLPEMRALATRIPCIDLAVSDQEIAALMRSVASQGYQIGDSRLDPYECMEVADFVIDESTRMGRQLDMRVLVNALADRLQSDDLDAGCGWQDLVASSLLGRPSVIGNVEPLGVRQQQKDRELAAAREVAGLPRPERLEQWRSMTAEISSSGAGLSESTMYRRLAELARIDSMGM